MKNKNATMWWSLLKNGCGYMGCEIQWNLHNETEKVLLKHTQIWSFTWHSLYKIMFLLPVMKDHLSWETTKFSGGFIQVLL